MRGRAKREPEIRRRFEACGYIVTDYYEDTNPLRVTIHFRVPGQEQWYSRDYSITFNGIDTIMENTVPAFLPNFVRNVRYDVHYRTMNLDEKYATLNKQKKRFGEALVTQFTIALKPSAYSSLTRLVNVVDVDQLSIAVRNAWWTVDNTEEELQRSLDHAVAVHQTEDRG